MLQRNRARIPLIRQVDPGECGLACLAMLAGAYGVNVRLRDLRREFGVPVAGTTVKTLVNISAELGFAARPLQAKLNQLNKVRVPCILHWDFNHYVIFLGGKRGRYTIIDPAIGKRTISKDELSCSFTGIAIEIEQVRKVSPRVGTSRLGFFQYWLSGSGISGRAAMVFLLYLGAKALVALTPLFLQLAVDWHLSEPSSDADKNLSVLDLAMIFGLAALLQGYVTWRRWAHTSEFGSHLNLESGNLIFRSVLGRDLRFFENRSSGDIMSRFQSAEALNRILSSSLVEALFDGLISMLLLITIFLYSPMIASLVIISGIGYCLLCQSLVARRKAATCERIAAESLQQSLLIETVESAQTLVLAGAQNQYSSRWANESVNRYNKELNCHALEATQRGAFSLIFGIDAVVCTFVAVLSAISQDISVGMVFAVLSYRAIFVPAFGKLVDQLFSLSAERHHLDRIEELVSPENLDPERKFNCPSSAANVPTLNTAESSHAEGQDAVVLRGVSFQYSHFEPSIISDCTFQLPRNKMSAIVGPSGSGKSTLLKLIMGVVSPTAGVINVFGRDQASIDLAELRKHFGAVMQDDRLLSGTVEQNITLFDPEIDRASIERCAKAAEIHDYITSIPMGYDAEVGQRGATLSGGQRQRLMIARALCMEPEILVLDEGTCHLDIETEAKVLSNLRKLLDRMTVVYVSHRAEAIEAADHVIQLSSS